MRDVQYSISARASSATRTDISVRNFSLIIDEPEKLGGTNAGPNPLEYELASLAGCLNVTGHLVAEEMGLTIGNFSLELSATLNPARFMGRGEEERAGFKEITVSVFLEHDGSEEAVQKWLRAVEERCPVSDNLSSGTTLSIALR